jgi:CRP-like cAMP-binding protein
MWETIVRSLPYLASLDEASRLDLLSGTTLRTLVPGDQLSIAREPLESVIVVRAGLLEELDERGARRRWLSGGDVVGERECVGRTNARGTIRVRRHASVVCLDAGALRRITQTSARVGAAMAEAAVCAHRDSTACMVESPSTDPAALAVSLHDAEAGDDARLVVYYADATDAGWSEAVAARADCIIEDASDF